MNNNDNTMSKMISVIALSVIFFIGYDYFYLQPQQKAYAEQMKSVKSTNQANSKNVSSSMTNTAQSSVKNNTMVASSKSIVVSTIQTQNNTIEIDNFGRISQVLLKGAHNDQSLKVFNDAFVKPLEVRFLDNTINDEAFAVPVSVSSAKLNATQSKQQLIITQNLSKTTMVKTITFYKDGHYDVSIKCSNNAVFFVTPGFRPDIIADMMTDHGALLVLQNKTINIIEDEDMDNDVDILNVNVVSAFDRYYTTVLYNFDKSMHITVMKDDTDSPLQFIHANSEISLTGYIGTKDYDTLQGLDDRLTDVIEYGWLTFLAKPMFALLKFAYDYIGNWGWTIVLVTIFIKFVLYPLAHKGMMSMNRLKELAPKMKALQEKYKDDKQKLSSNMMSMYKDENVSPFGGCLPIILQIPIFFAFYRVLLNAVELQGASWMLWIDDLSLMDPYYILPVLMTLSMFIQQKLTPTQIQDELQKKMMLFMPLIFGIFFLWFPAGLVLYWIVNNTFTIVHQLYINKLFVNAKEARDQKKHIKK